jgi:hypothetical protein
MRKTAQKFEVSFSWHKHRHGYKWENSQPCGPWGEPFDSQDIISSAPDGPFLVEKTPGIVRVPYKPLENPLLFAQFSDIIPSEESFLDWADEYGRLIDIEGNAGCLYDFILSPYTPRDKRKADSELLSVSSGKHRIVEKDGLYYRIAKPDPLSFWKREHRDLSFAVMLWEMASSDDSKLSGILEWREDSRRAYAYPFSRDKLGSIDFGRLGHDEDYNPDFVLPPCRIENYHPKRFDVKKAASRYIQQEINRKMRLYPLTIRFEMDGKEEVHKVIEPTSLLSAMWYQFFLARTGEIKLKRCSICGKWESMEGHRETWSKHANCANYNRVKRARLKKRGKAE